MSTRTVVSMALVAAALLGTALLAHAITNRAPAAPADRGGRVFVVSVKSPDGWREVGTRPFGRFVATQTYDLEARGEITIRLVARGGGAAHLDAVLLEGAPAIGGPAKLAAVDHDVVDAASPVELTFAGGGALAVTGRIEPTVISKTPFQFPRGNTFTNMSAESLFYAYELGSRPGRLTVDGELSEDLGEPLFVERIHCDSGHPQGATFGWVRNDDTHLYVALDFTPDNTMDGEADYATVFVRRGGELLEHKVTVSEQRWGRAGFTYTDRVGYQHKTYELAIPLDRVRSPGSDQLELAFATYGTASAGMNGTDPLAFDPISESFVLIYWDTGSDFDLTAQRYDATASTVGVAMPLGSTLGSQPFCSLAADTINGAFLVVWQDSTDYKIYGRRVFSNGTVDAARFDVSTTTTGNSVGVPRVAFDAVNQRWLAIWADRRSGSADYLYGRFVGSDGVAQGSDLTLHDSSVVTGEPSVVHNGVDQFLVVYAESAGGGLFALRLDASDGSPIGTSLALGDGSISGVAYSSVTDRYLVGWRSTSGIVGRTVAPDGTLGVEQTLMTVPSGNFYNVALVAHPVVDRFAVVSDDQTSGRLWAQYIDAVDAVAVGNAFPFSDVSLDPDWNGAAINTANHGILAGSYDTNGGAPFVAYANGLCFAGAPATTAESGATAQIDVRLCAAPTGDVVIDVASDDTGEGTVDVSSFTFTTSNWQTIQSVTVTPVDDATEDGDVEYLVTFTVNDANSADEYDGIIDAVRVTNTDAGLPPDGGMGDPGMGDPGMGDPATGDPGAGDPGTTAGDPASGGDPSGPGLREEEGCSCHARGSASWMLALGGVVALLARRRRS